MMAGNIRVYEIKKRENLILRYIYLAIMAFCGCYGCICSLMEYFGDYALESSEILLLSCVSIIAVIGLGIGKNRVIGWIIYSGILLLYSIFAFDAIVEGVVYMIRGFVKEAAKNSYSLLVEEPHIEFTHDENTAMLCATLWIVMVLSAIISLYLNERRCIFLNIVLVILISFVGVFVDIKPSLVGLSFSIAYIFACLVYVGGAKLGSSVAMLMYSLLFSLLMAIVVSQLYFRPYYFDQFKEDMDKGLTDFFEDIYTFFGGEDNNSIHGRLSGSPKYTGKTVLRVTMPIQRGEYVYLRSSTSSSFHDNMWDNENLPDFDYVYEYVIPDTVPYDSIMSIGKAVDLPEDVVHVGDFIVEKTKYTKNEFVLAYGAGFDGKEFVLSNHMSYVPNDGSYTLPYVYVDKDATLDAVPVVKRYRNRGVSIFGFHDDKLASPYNIGVLFSYFADPAPETEEHLYSDYVEENYNEIPARYQELFDEIAEKSGFSSYDKMYSFEERLDLLKKYIDTSGYVYNINFKPSKADVDDLLYDFMVNTKSGFCVHYASFVTLFLRSQGIPARYVEGYIITPDLKRDYYTTDEGMEYSIVDIPDNKAHAWTEVYVSGYGWMPFECTPTSAGYTNSNYVPEPTTQAQIQTTTQAIETESEEETTEEVTTEASSKADPDNKTTMASTEAPKNSGKSTTTSRVFTIIILVILAVILIIVTIWLVIHARIKKLLDRENPDVSKKRYYKLYAHLEKELYKRGIERRDDMSYLEFATLVGNTYDIGMDIVTDELLAVRFGQGEVSEENIKNILYTIETLTKREKKD
ncbi:MAG TPA: hypothetical protein DEO82_05430 [Eubacterium sp.]|nr:hypothetical protein [Eubacterium sp.]